MREHLDECVLHGLIGIVRIAQVLVGNPGSPPLLAGDQLGKPLPGGIPFARENQPLDGAGQLRILRQREPGRRFPGGCGRRTSRRCSHIELRRPGGRVYRNGR